MDVPCRSRACILTIKNTSLVLNDALLVVHERQLIWEAKNDKLGRVFMENPIGHWPIEVDQRCMPGVLSACCRHIDFDESNVRVVVRNEARLCVVNRGERDSLARTISNEDAKRFEIFWIQRMPTGDNVHVVLVPNKKHGTADCAWVHAMVRL